MLPFFFLQLSLFHLQFDCLLKKIYIKQTLISSRQISLRISATNATKESCFGVHSRVINRIAKAESLYSSTKSLSDFLCATQYKLWAISIAITSVSLLVLAAAESPTRTSSLPAGAKTTKPIAPQPYSIPISTNTSSGIP